MRDTVNMVRLGIPAVGLVHHPFEKLAQMQCRQLGMPDAPILIYPQDLPSVDAPEAVLAKARAMTDRLLSFLIRT